MISCRNASLTNKLSDFGIRELATLGLKDRNLIRHENDAKISRKLLLDDSFKLVIQSTIHYLKGDRQYVDVIPANGINVARMYHEDGEALRTGKMVKSFITENKIAIRHGDLQNVSCYWDGWKIDDYNIYLGESGYIAALSKYDGQYSYFIPQCNVYSYTLKPQLDLNVLNDIVLGRNTTMPSVLISMAKQLPKEEWIRTLNITEEELAAHGIELAV